MIFGLSGVSRKRAKERKEISLCAPYVFIFAPLRETFNT